MQYSYKVSINLRMDGHPRAAVEQFFDDLDDALQEVRESLTKTPDLQVTITAEEDPDRGS